MEFFENLSSGLPDSLWTLKEKLLHITMTTVSGPPSLTTASTNIPSSLHKEGVKTHLKLNCSAAPVVLNPDSVLTSVKDSLKNITSDQPASPADVNSPTVMCITPISLIPADAAALDLGSLPQERSADQKKGSYKLTEVVTQEKDQLFQGATDYELEPHQFMSTRRRSRNFFTLAEEEEDDTVQTDIEPHEDHNKKSVHVPVFHLGKSLRRLYYPFEKQKRNPLQAVSDSTEEPLSGYTSEPETSPKLLQKIASESTIRRISSTPQLSIRSEADTCADNDDSFHYSNYTKSKALAATQEAVSRKLQKRPTKGVADGTVVDQKGPRGFSIFSHLAGDLHVARRPTSASNEDVSDDDAPKTMAFQSKNDVGKKDDKSSALSRQNQGRVELVSGGGGAPNKREEPNKPEKPSFVKSMISWGTTATVKVTHKEANIYSPTSF